MVIGLFKSLVGIGVAGIPHRDPTVVSRDIGPPTLWPGRLALRGLSAPIRWCTTPGRVAGTPGQEGHATVCDVWGAAVTPRHCRCAARCGSLKDPRLFSQPVRTRHMQVSLTSLRLQSSALWNISNPNKTTYTVCWPAG